VCCTGFWASTAAATRLIALQFACGSRPRSKVIVFLQQNCRNVPAAVLHKDPLRLDRLTTHNAVQIQCCSGCCVLCTACRSATMPNLDIAAATIRCTGTVSPTMRSAWAQPHTRGVAASHGHERCRIMNAGCRSMWRLVQAALPHSCLLKARCVWARNIRPCVSILEPAGCCV